MKSRVVKMVLLVGMALMPLKAMAYTHNYIDKNRSSLENTLYISQGMEGAFGRFKAVGREDGDSVRANEFWSGWGVRSAAGIELFKFLRFGASHTMVKQSSQDSALERLGGTRLSGDMSLSFASPMGSLVLGGGVLGGSYEYSRDLTTGEFFSSGSYYSVGTNYFIAPTVSVTFDVRNMREHLIRSSGSTAYRSMDLDLQVATVGFSLWL
jgi:hypothetical protein